MIRPLRSLRRRTVLLASGTAVLLAVGGGATAAVASTTGGTPTPSSTPAACSVHLRAELRGALPASLKADLKTLRSEPKGAQRVAERKLIRQKALSGAYGVRDARLAHLVAGKAGASVRVQIPAALRADLKTLRATAPKSTARAAERTTIEQKALAGDYGSAIQTRAKAVQARFQARCAAATTK
ncbi:MAG: hypothetical protein HIU86_06340 [Acidobacteria bacterium]|nr:hypothetical protein [Acidobacteriota bacterium]